MRTVIETPQFQRQAADLWSEAERLEFIDFMAAHPDAGDVIPGAEGARKIRWSRKGLGKRGGVRVIYWHLTDDQIVWLALMYAKSERETVSWKQIFRSLR